MSTPNPVSSPLLPVHLISPRLQFRLMEESDLPSLVEFTGNPEAVRFFPSAKSPQDYARQWLDLVLDRYATRRGGLLALIHRETGAYVGHAGLLVQEVDGITELEIGYHLLPKFWHQGYATEAARAFKEYAFETRLAPSIISIIHRENFPSQKVAERNGMIREKATVWREMEVFVYRIIQPE